MGRLVDLRAAPQTKGTIAGNNDVYPREHPPGPFLVHTLVRPNPPPPKQPVSAPRPPPPSPPTPAQTVR